jgi:hypothetical protein
MIENETTERIREKVLRAGIGFISFMAGLPIGLWSMTFPNALVINPLIISLLLFALGFMVAVWYDERLFNQRAKRFERFHRLHPDLYVKNQ